MITLMQYLYQFLISGASVVAILFISKNLGTKYGAALYSLPIEFTILLILMYRALGSETIKEYLFGSIFYSLSFLSFVILFYFLINRLGFTLSLLTSLTVCLSIIFIVLNFLK